MTRLGDVCTIYTGTGFPTQYQGNDEGQYPFYKVGDISRNASAGNRILNFCDNFVDYDVVKAIKGTLIPAGTVVFAKIGEAVKLNRRAITGCECLVDNNAMGIKPNEQHVLLDYFFHFISNVHMENLAEATTVPSVKKSVIEKIDIPVPPINEQNRIASEINQVDALISLRKQQIAKLDELVKAWFVEMFGAHSADSIRLKDCCVDVRGGGTPSMQHPEYYGGNVPFIKSGDVRGDSVSSGALWLSEKALIETTAKYVPKGSVLVVNRSAALLREFRAAIASQPVVINQDIKAFIPKREFTSEYLLWAIKIQTRYLLTKVTTVLTSHIDLADLLELRIAPVPIEQQQQFTNFVAQTDQQKLTIQHSLAQLELLKKALMQKYFG